DRYDPLPPAWRQQPRTDVLVAGLREQQRAQRMAPEGDKLAMRQAWRREARDGYLEAVGARAACALDASAPFVERLVHFWSNHFAVSVDKVTVVGLAGALEADAIRPHVLGRFEDMLLAATRHPAMLLYLDQAASIGPDSPLGRRAAQRQPERRRGLNENLAREILELHTLGVRTGYTQADVTGFAKVITGWSLVPPRLDPVRGGAFMFNERLHEPGAQTVIGRTYADGGFEQGRAVLDDLARHPATAKHISTKLARHFIADDPPPALVEKLSQRFLLTGGDLKEVTKTLVAAPESWQAQRSKLKTPGEWIMATLRANRLPIKDVRKVVGAQAILGEPLWRPPAPKGFSDDSAAWLDGLAQRLDIANQVGRIVGNAGQEPDAMVDAALGPLASRDTREAVARAESRPQALALLLMAPEFQRR
ncbi:MAG TPA: DUF1800 domain-containing protein, partial [Pseudolabrys sp.]|nr:DUF1800 domain-containing protein [Pseudolabrys sp.]